MSMAFDQGFLSNTGLETISWHHAAGRLIDSLQSPLFWHRLCSVFQTYIEIDNWVAMRFEADRCPQVLAVCDADKASFELLEGYLQSAHLLDPFYIAMCDSQSVLPAGLVTLNDVAPDNFTRTEYYQRYFSLVVLNDEIQYIAPLSDSSWVSISFGRAKRFRAAELQQLRICAPWVVALMRQRINYEPQSESLPRPWAAESVASRTAGLTAREWETMQLVLSGYSTKMIARRMNISAETVKVHRRHLYAKLKISSQSQLFSFFLKLGGQLPVTAAALLGDLA